MNKGEYEFSGLVQSYKKADDIGTSVNAISITNVVQGLFYLLYLNLVVMQYTSPPFFYGLYDGDITVSPPGTFVDRRYSFFWVLMFIQVSRLITYIFYQLLATTQHYSRWLFEIHRILNIVFLVFGIIYFLILVVIYGLNCNSILWAENPCNSKDYCKAYGNTFTTICRSTEFDSSFNPLTLTRNIIFTGDIIFAILFVCFDIVQLVIVQELKLSIARYVYLQSK